MNTVIKFILSVSILTLVISCNAGSRNEELKTKPSTTETKASAPAGNKLKGNDCYSDRKVVKVVGEQTGSIIKSGEFLIIDCPNLATRYHACDLPDWAVEGTTVRISGVVKEVFENEKRAGEPFIINTITQE